MTTQAIHPLEGLIEAVESMPSWSGHADKGIDWISRFQVVALIRQYQARSEPVVVEQGVEESVAFLLDQLITVNGPLKTKMWEAPDGEGGQFSDKRVALLCWLNRLRPTTQAAGRDAIADIVAERRRQVLVEGWIQQHDDEHIDGDMAEAAACYCMTHRDSAYDPPVLWPWATSWWKPKNRRRDLIRAAALIVAEIERIDRAAIQQGGSNDQ